MNNEKKSKSILLWLLIILAPILAGWIIGLITGTSPLKLDAWNTAWNDENGYFRVIRTMRHYGIPQGVTGFNEITSGNIPFGPYNIFTYIPYFLLSFITGCSSHNYIYYCNLILAVAANLIFVLLTRPSRRNSFLIALFFLTQLILARYTWSGMAEASYHFYIVIFMGLVIWYLRSADASLACKNIALLAMILLTFCFSVMRPYFLPLFLIPLYLLIFRNPRMGLVGRFLFALLILASMAGALVLMYYLMNYIAEYFEIAPAMRLAQLILGGGVKGIASGLLQTNKDSVHAAMDLVREYRWAGGVAFLFYFEWILLFLEFIYSLIARRKDGSTAVLFLLLFSGALIYEATIMLYKSYQLHRMLLAITIAFTLFLIEFGIALPWVNSIAVICLVAFYVLMKPSGFALPQTADTTVSAAEYQTYKKELVSLLPYADPIASTQGGTRENKKSRILDAFETPASLDPYWNNTVAKITEDNHIQLSYLMPDYLSFNICTEKYMKKAITSDSFNSRYVMVKTDSRLDKLCADRYRLLWQKHDHSIYDRQEKP